MTEYEKGFQLAWFACGRPLDSALSSRRMEVLGFPLRGIALRGPDEIRGYYDKAFAKMPPDLRHVTTIRDFEVINPDLVAMEVEVDILGTNPKTGTAQTPLVLYGGLGLGVRTDSGWRIRLARVYQVAK